jgi:hypothetical protein
MTSKNNIYQIFIRDYIIFFINFFCIVSLNTGEFDISFKAPCIEEYQ